MASAQRKPPTPHAEPFLRLARCVSRRLRISTWLRALRATALPVCALLLALLALGLLAHAGGRPDLLRLLLLLGFALTLLWLALVSLRAVVQRVAPSQALAVFDAQTESRERFLSAYSFACESTPGVGAALHVRRTLPGLEPAIADVGRALPLRPRVPLTYLAAALLMLGLLGLLDHSARPVPAQQDSLAASGMPASQEDPEPAHPLTDPRGGQEALERRAAEAARLASESDPKRQEIGAALLAALARHAETAPLAKALQSEAGAAAAGQASRLARRLQAENLSQAAQGRIESALRSALAAASNADKKSPLVRQLAQAQEKLAEDQSARAGEALERLAQKLRRIEQDQRTRDTAKRLARRTPGPRGDAGKLQRVPDLPPGRRVGTAAQPGPTLPGGRAGTRPGVAGTPGGPAGDGQADKRDAGSGNANGARPGYGSTPIGSDATTALPATHDEAVPARVAANRKKKWERHKPPPKRDPQSALSSERVTTAFEKVSESPLPSDALSLSREALVGRYLRTLRERFEAAEDGSKR